MKKNICQMTVFLLFYLFLLKLYAYMLNNLKYVIWWKTALFVCVVSCILVYVKSKSARKLLTHMYTHLTKTKLNQLMAFMMYMLDTVSGYKLMSMNK